MDALVLVLVLFFSSPEDQKFYYAVSKELPYGTSMLGCLRERKREIEKRKKDGEPLPSRIKCMTREKYKKLRNDEGDKKFRDGVIIEEQEV